jgi:murein L,D-transpeptidase YafK
VIYALIHENPTMKKLIPLGVVIMLVIALIAATTLAGNDRAFDARLRTIKAVKELCSSQKIAFPPSNVVFRAWKNERILEVWANGKMLKSYPIAAMSGGLGPKRKEGDRQVPEGLYSINRFNPKSLFHLSLGLNYPNASDRILGDQAMPGGDIFIHGSNKSIGCLAMGDAQIEEIYTLAKASRGRIQVLILPSQTMPIATSLDRQLKAINLLFEKNRKLPSVTIDREGNYVVSK